MYIFDNFFGTIKIADVYKTLKILIPNEFSPCHLSFPPFTNVPIDLSIEKNQQNEWDHSQNDESSPVEVDRVVGVHSKLGNVQNDAVLGGIGQVC